MTALLATLALFLAVALLMLANTRRAQCRMRGHDWERPYTEDKRRLERCRRCATVRDHVFTVPTSDRLDARSIDGSVPVTVIVSPRVIEPEVVETPDEIGARRKAISERVRAKHSGGLTSGRIQ